jgi:hypothetical protein
MHLRFKVIMEVTMKIAIIWGVTSYSSEKAGSLRETQRHHLHLRLSLLGLESTIPVFEQTKTICGHSDRLLSPTL